MADITDIYTLAHERMLNSTQRSPGAAPSDKYAQNSEYGPYHAQYWSLVGGNLESQVPVPSNGGYQSPYGTTAPEVYFPSVTVQSPTDSYGELNQSNGYDHPDGSVYTLGRNPQFACVPQPVSPSVYPSPVDNFGWNYFSSVESSTQTVASLDNLATQILNTLLTGSLDEVVATVSQSGTAHGQAFSNLESMFHASARSLPRDSSNLFIDTEQAQFIANGAGTAARKANLALFAMSIFKGRDIPFTDLDAAFLDMFMPTGTCLLLNEGSLFLELKTQAFMAMSMGQSYPRENLEQLFPRDLQLTILRRRPDSHHLAATEQDFISRYTSRRQHLTSCCDDVDALNQLPARYSWNDLLGELRTCVNRNLEYLERVRPVSASTVSASTSDDPITKAALVAHAAISGQQGNNLYSPTLLQTPSMFESHKRKRSSGASDSSMSPESPNAPLHLQYRSHTVPAPSKSQSPFASGAQRRISTTPNARRPWTPDEEKALMDGLERVKGPHWSQILALYGTGGSISEILKDRNQVQLKDKARNLKLFFLKSGMDVPFFLQKVTGELKTRAPAQAAKLEAREKMKRLEEQKSGMKFE